MFLEEKRGSMEELWKMFFSIVLLLGIALTFTLFVSRYVEDDSFTREVYARDNAMLLDSIRGSSGDAILLYRLDGNEGKYDFRFSTEAVGVKGTNRPTATERFFPHNPSSSFDFHPNTINSSPGHSYIKAGRIMSVTALAGGGSS